MKIKRTRHVMCLGALLALVFISCSTFAAATLEDENDVIRWAGCGITKKAFMTELAAAYQEKTKVKVILEGGGATRGIRESVGVAGALGWTPFAGSNGPTAWYLIGSFSAGS